MKANIFKSCLLFLTVGILSFACNKSDTFHDNRIKILSGKKKETIVISSYAFNGGSQVQLDKFNVTEIENYPNILLYLE